MHDAIIPNWELCAFEELKGKTVLRILISDDSSRMYFETDDQKIFVHDGTDYPGCEILEIDGDLGNLIGCEIVFCEDSSNSKSGSEWHSETWTFYKIGTSKETITIRWYGSSNGYYSESPAFYELRGFRIPYIKKVYAVNNSSEGRAKQWVR